MMPNGHLAVIYKGVFSLTTFTGRCPTLDYPVSRIVLFLKFVHNAIVSLCLSN